MQVDAREVELATDEENRGADGRESPGAAGLAFGDLEQSVQGFEKAVGLARLRPGEDAFDVAADQFGGLLSWVRL